MRYLVTGSAGFIGSHLSEALRAEGHEVVGLDCFTDYYDVALKEENARGQEILRLDLARDPIDLAGFDGVFHLAGQPGVRSFGDVFETYLERNVLASQRLFEAAARDGVRVVFASSSSVYGDAEAYPTAGDASPAAGLAVRDHEARLRAPRPRDGEELRPRRRRARATSTPMARGSGPTWRSPASRCASPRAARSTSSATGSSRAASPTSPMSSAATIAGDGRAAAAPTTSAAARRRRCATRSRSSRSSPAARSRSAITPPCRATSAARRPTRR